MRAGITTSRGWLGFNLHDGKLSVGLIPHRGFTIDVKTERVLRDMTAGKHGDFVTAVKVYAQHWWSLGRPMPWTIARRARQYARWQREIHHRTPPPWPFGEIMGDPDPRASVRI